MKFIQIYLIQMICGIIVIFLVGCAGSKKTAKIHSLNEYISLKKGEVVLPELERGKKAEFLDKSDNLGVYYREYAEIHVPLTKWISIHNINKNLDYMTPARKYIRKLASKYGADGIKNVRICRRVDDEHRDFFNKDINENNYKNLIISADLVIYEDRSKDTNQEGISITVDLLTTNNDDVLDRGEKGTFYVRLDNNSINRQYIKSIRLVSESNEMLSFKNSGYTMLGANIDSNGSLIFEIPIEASSIMRDEILDVKVLVYDRDNTIIVESELFLFATSDK